jgi:hypothetical protein
MTVTATAKRRRSQARLVRGRKLRKHEKMAIRMVKAKTR